MFSNTWRTLYFSFIHLLFFNSFNHVPLLTTFVLYHLLNLASILFTFYSIRRKRTPFLLFCQFHLFSFTAFSSWNFSTKKEWLEWWTCQKWFTPAVVITNKIVLENEIPFVIINHQKTIANTKSESDNGLFLF